MSFRHLCRKAVLGILLAATSILATPAVAQIERISVGAEGVQSNADSYQAKVSDDGQVVAFRSNANNLVIGDDNSWPDVFVRDSSVGTTEKVSGDIPQQTRYTLNPGISDDGQLVVMQSDLVSKGTAYIVVRDRLAASSTVLYASGTNNEALLEPVISGNGQFVGFYTFLNLQGASPPEARPVNDDSNSAMDVFVYHWKIQPARATERISRDSAGHQGRGDSVSPSISDNGRYIAFYSYADDLVAGDNNNSEDIFVKDRQTAGVVMASVASDGTIGNGASYKPVISGDGKFVAFRSKATNLVAGDTNRHWDIFVHDLTFNTTERVSVSSEGVEANHDSLEVDISDDGRFVVFRSNASNLVAGDSNHRFDIFVHDRYSLKTLRVSMPATGESDGHSYSPAISGNGAWILFESDATNLIADDTNASRDIFRVSNPLLGAP